MQYKIANCVFIVNLEYEVDLVKISRILKGRYNPEKFAGAILPVENNYGRKMLLFPHGKAVLHITDDDVDNVPRKLKDLAIRVEAICRPYKIGTLNETKIGVEEWKKYVYVNMIKLLMNFQKDFVVLLIAIVTNMKEAIENVWN